MNCRDIEPLLSAERDHALTKEQRVSLDQHVAACPVCSEARGAISQAMELFKDDATAVTVPDVEEEWRKLSANLTVPLSKRPQRRPIAPLIWFGAPLAAAAAVAFAFFGQSSSTKSPAETVATPTEVAQAEYVEPGNANASTMVYVDKDSGWLVVWATDSDTESKI